MRNDDLRYSDMANDPSVSDEYILEQLADLNLVTNTLNAARVLMKTFAPVCAYRPHLEEKLLSRVLVPLWMTDFKTDHVLAWIQSYLVMKPPFEGLKSPGLEWVQGLMDRRDFIDRLLSEVDKQQNELWTQPIREVLMPHSKLPIERIQFRYGEIDNRLAQQERTVVFIYLDLSTAESINAFGTLTTVMHELDPDRRIDLIVFDGDDYIEIVDTKIQQMLDANRTDEDLVQVMWFRGSNPTHVVKHGDSDAEIYKEHTLHLLNTG